MENSKKVLNGVGVKIVNELKELSKRDNFYASGNLENSFSYDIEGDTVNVYGAKYTKALSDGISSGNGSTGDFKQKLSNIREWARSKGIQPRTKGGRFMKNSDRNFKNMTFQMAVSIGRKGISKRFGYKGSGFFEEMKKNAINNVTEMVAEAYKLDIIVKIK